MSLHPNYITAGAGAGAKHDDIDYAKEHENGTSKSHETSSSTSTKQPKWPSYITAEWFKKCSNYFTGMDEVMLFKAMLSIRVMIGMGVFIASFLPFKYSLALASVLLLPSIIRTLLYESGMMRDAMQEDVFPPVHSHYTAAIEGDFCVLILCARSNKRYPTGKQLYCIQRSRGEGRGVSLPL
jgi:hypothetical protein